MGKQHQGKGKAQKGFTLVEILVVLGIIAIIGAAVFYFATTGRRGFVEHVQREQQFRQAVIDECGRIEGYGPYLTCEHAVRKRLHYPVPRPSRDYRAPRPWP